MNRRPLLAFLGLLCLMLSPLVLGRAQDAAEAPPVRAELPAVPEPVRQALLAGEYDAALEALATLQQGTPELADFWMYLEVVALASKGEREAAVAKTLALEAAYPASIWGAKSRFRRAELYRELRRFEEAEEIFEDAARALRAPARQGELAAIYIEFADEASTEPDTPRPDRSGLDYARAHQLYAKVLELDAPADARDHALYRMAYCREKLGAWAQAAQEYQRYLDELPAGARRFEAGYHKGFAQLQAGQRAQARRSLEDLLADAQAAGDAVDEELLGDARVTLARTWSTGDAWEYPMAIAAFERFLAAHPAHREAPQAAFAIAELYRALGRSDDALAAYAAFRARPKQAGWSAEVLEEDERLRMESLYLEGFVLQGRGDYAAASTRYAQYTQRYATGPRWSAAQQGIVDCAWSVGHKAREDGDLAGARTAWEAFLAAWPLDARAGQVQLDLAELHVEEAVAAREAGGDPAPHYRAALERWKVIAQKYPGSNEASQALYRSGFVNEVQLKELQAAIVAYRACDFGGHASAAAARLATMTQPALTVLTERKWRAGDDAVVKVQTRNHEELEVRVYALDLEAYFRKHLTHQRIEDLDLDLIEPDQTFEVALADYAQYKPLEQLVTLPVEGPGVWAVALIAGEQRATTLVVRSDIDVVIKSSRREAFVFAQDMPRGAPAPGVRVLLALPGMSEGGAPLLKELETGDDGVARLAFDELANAADLRVFAARDGHCASNGLSLNGLVRSAGLQPRGLVYTDRSVYRPGERLAWRAILRDVEGGSYAFKAGADCRVEIADSAGRVIRRQNLPLSPFGTLHGELDLADEAPVGGYHITCRTPQGNAFQGAFQVQQYELRKVELSLAPARDVYFRGEKVEVTARAAWYYGEPVAGAPLRYRLPDGSELETRTNEAGEATFTFATRDFPSEGQLGFMAWLPEEQVSASGAVYLAINGFRAALETPGRVVLAGDPFTVRLSTSAPGGAPVAQAMSLRVLRKVSKRGTWSELSVSEHTLTTDAEHGVAELVLNLEQGGQYVLRAQAQDRFGNPVVATAEQFVSGDDDSTRLRILTDRTRVKVGETLTLDLHDRAGPGLALLTFEGETILAYRLVAVAEGSNAIEFPVTGAHFPNVTVSAALMQPGKFFEAQAEFDVARELVVKIVPEQDVYAPGEEARVTLEVTDQLGRPIETELSLAVVDDALFQVYPDGVPALRPFFESAARRQAGLRTETSCTFSYVGTTVQIDANVLAEQRRLADAQTWGLEREQLAEKLAALGYLSDGPAGAPAANARPPGGPSTPGPTAGGGGRTYRGAGDTLPPGADAGVSGSDDFFLGRAERRTSDSKRQNDGERGAPGLDLFGDTLFWTPAAVTGADGKALITFTLPERSTRWRLTARGTSKDTLVGDARATIRSRAAFFVELRAPASLTQGDHPRLGARVHNLTGRQGTGRLVLQVKSPEGERSFTRDVVFGDAPVVEVLFDALTDFDAAHDLALSARIEATLGAETLTAVAAEDVPVRPYGVAFADSAGGVLDGQTSVWLELPAGRAYASRSLELFVGPSTRRLLIDEALGQGARFASIGPRLPSSAEVHAGDLIGVCAVLESLIASGGAERLVVEALRTRGEGLVAALAAAQGSDGGWPGAGYGRASEAPVSARVALALAAAKRAGLQPPDDTVRRAVAQLQAAYRGASQQEDEKKAMLQHGLAALGEGEFAALNRLHRERNSLSPAALAYTALALVEQGRGPMATELAELLEALASPAPVGRRGLRTCSWPVADNVAWNRSPVEMVALTTEALQRTLPASEKVAQGIAFLNDHRPWPARARGLVVATLARYERETQPRADRVAVTVRVAGGDAQTIQLDRDEAGRMLTFPLDGVDAKEVQVDLSLAGRGRPHFAAVLRGFSPDMQRTSRRDTGLEIAEHVYRPAPPRYAGRELPTGFGVVTDMPDEWSNAVDHLPFGQTTRVRVTWRRDARIEGDGHLLLEVPLPAGAALLDGSLSAGGARHELAHGALVVPLDPERTSGALEFTLIGTVPGEYKVLPAMLRSLHDPSKMALGDADEFAVLARGVASPDEYKPTPDELYHLGKAQYEAGDMDGAHASLSALYGQFEPWLREQVLTDAASKLLFLAIDRRASDRIVEYFEVVKEKNPALTIPFEQIVAIGEAYRALGEFERAMLIFRATILETFGKDLKVAGTLEGLGEFAGATDTLEDLWLAYPDAPSVVETYLTLADKLLAKAPSASSDASLKRAGRSRADLTLAGVRHLQRFMALYPTDPLAADAGLNLVAARLGLEDYEAAAELGAEFARRFAEPRYADAFLYTRAVAQWYLGQEDEALGALKAIAASEYIDESGNTTPSENRDLALYILGQIHHARREAEQAAEYYERVQDLFADAREALLGFREKEISIEEVTNARPGGEAELTITYRNIEQAELLVYGVDLMTLYLREKNLSNITSVNLSGISPTLRQVVQLGSGSDLRPKEATAQLALSEPGAYLVICRGEELFTSGLVLVTDLELDVKEDPVSGRMRIQALDQTDGSYERGVDVRVIGSANAAFTSGETDPRGLFVADGVAGQATVIAHGDGGHYAFFRGATLLAQAQQQPQQQRHDAEFGNFGEGLESGYLDNVLQFNAAQMGSRAGRYREELDRERKGVQVQQVK